MWIEGTDDPDACPSSIKPALSSSYVVTLEDLGYCWVSVPNLPVYSNNNEKSKQSAIVGRGNVIETLEIGEENERGTWLKVRVTGEIRAGYETERSVKKPVTGWIFGKLPDIIKCK